jgi:hypothetical protein
VVGCEGVCCPSVALSTDPAVGCCVSDLFCSPLVVPCIVGSGRFGVLSVPFALASFTSVSVCCKCSAG